jgi:uncharacterized protein YcnI
LWIVPSMVIVPAWYVRWQKGLQHSRWNKTDKNVRSGVGKVRKVVQEENPHYYLKKVSSEITWM